MPMSSMAPAASASDHRSSAGPCVVVMGVSGCGKSTLGRQLAVALAVPFLEGDELHPPANVLRMAAGIALTDADRVDWLAAIARRLADGHATGQGLVVACSALRRPYRDRLRSAAPDLRLVHLRGEPALIAQRLASRQGHYMPPTLLQSQLQTLEPPGPDERAVALDVADPPTQLLRAALVHLAAMPPGAATPSR
ncbi:MAG: gluconokinase [Aquabacterium sp.]